MAAPDLSFSFDVSWALWQRSSARIISPDSASEVSPLRGAAEQGAHVHCRDDSITNVSPNITAALISSCGSGWPSASYGLCDAGLSLAQCRPGSVWQESPPTPPPPFAL